MPPGGRAKRRLRTGACGNEAMNLSRIFIERPVATILLAIGVVLSGLLAYRLLPVSPLPQVD